jgi:hypothetical protein
MIARSTVGGWPKINTFSQIEAAFCVDYGQSSEHAPHAGRFKPAINAVTEVIRKVEAGKVSCGLLSGSLPDI